MHRDLMALRCLVSATAAHIPRVVDTTAFLTHALQGGVPTSLSGRQPFILAPNLSETCHVTDRPRMGTAHMSTQVRREIPAMGPGHHAYQAGVQGWGGKSLSAYFLRTMPATEDPGGSSSTSQTAPIPSSAQGAWLRSDKVSCAIN